MLRKMESFGKNGGDSLEGASSAVGDACIGEIKNEEPESYSDANSIFAATNFGIPEMRINEDGTVDVIVAVRVKKEKPESIPAAIDQFEETTQVRNDKIKLEEIPGRGSSKVPPIPVDSDPKFLIAVKSESETRYLNYSESGGGPSHNYGTRRCTRWKKFVCDECGSLFGKESSLWMHEESHQPYSCSHCKYKSKKKKSLRNHIIQSHLERMIKLQQGKKEYSCAQCEYRSWAYICLKKHIIVRHLGDKPYSCAQCKYKCMTKVALKRHSIQRHPRSKMKRKLRKHISGPQAETWYSCGQCSRYKSRDKRLLRSHIRRVHGDRSILCPECDYKTTFHASMKTHISRVHKGEKPFACDECDYKAAYKPGLVSHKMIHSDERPFPCSLCSYSARKKVHLVRHVRTHSGEKPYSCELCDYRSTQKYNITIHMRSHNRVGTKMKSTQKHPQSK